MDSTFGLVDKRGDKAKRGLHFLEFDTGSESYVRTAPDQTSILQKYFGYADAYSRGLTEKLFGYKAFRVLFVVDANERRIDSMIDTYKTHASDRIRAGSFLFTTLDKLVDKGFLADIWLNGEGVETPILKGELEPLIQSTLQEQMVNV